MSMKEFQFVFVTPVYGATDLMQEWLKALRAYGQAVQERGYKPREAVDLRREGATVLSGCVFGDEEVLVKLFEEISERSWFALVHQLGDVDIIAKPSWVQRYVSLSD